MLDHPVKTYRLLRQLIDLLPLEAKVSTKLAQLLWDEVPGIAAGQTCCIIDATNSGESGGIMCMIDIEGIGSDQLVLASITHLEFAPGSPAFREIAAYQRRRGSRLREIHLADKLMNYGNHGRSW